jgi:hypothetical protein
MFCGATVPAGTYCPACGKALRKWCPQCAKWKPSNYTFYLIDNIEGTSPATLLGSSQEEAKYCQDCGAPLEVKGAPLE